MIMFNRYMKLTHIVIYRCMSYDVRSKLIVSQNFLVQATM